MHRLLKKEQILTIPNLLSLVRLAMIPVIVWLYCKKEAYLAAVAMIVLSGLTDIADGIIARKCNMVSDFGKILDPVADKLTQAALILCLATRYQLMIPLIIEFALREAAMLAMGYAAIKKKDTKPDFDGSAPIFTSSRTSCLSPLAAAQRSMQERSSRLSALWMREASPTTCLTLFF